VSTGKIITIREILDKTTAFFEGKGIGTARLDAQILLAEALGFDRLKLYLNLDRPLDETELAKARELVRRRGGREPIAYILGKKEFAGRDFKVGPGVLVPRPDTEILVEEVGKELLARSGGEGGPVRVLEFGVGSGAIAVTLAADMPAVHVTATEINQAAAATAKQNAGTHGVADRVEVLLQPDFTGIAGPFHVIVSNPPYIDIGELPTLTPDVASFEPHEALFADDAGLKWYRYLAAQAAGELLAAGGILAVEVGHTQAKAVTGIFEAAGLAVVRVVKDFAGIERVVVAEKRTEGTKRT